MPKKEIESEASRFISVISGILIVVAVAAMLMATLQYELIQTRVSFEDIQLYLDSPRGQRLPDIVRFYHNNLLLMAQVALFVSAFTLFNAVGLLKRKNWARLYFMLFFLAGIAWCVGGMLMYEAMVPDALQVGGSLRESTSVVILHIFRVVSYAVSSGFIILFLWLIRKLSLSEIRKEFRE